MDTIKFKNEINLEQIKKIELDILVEFHKICEINNLRYSLSCGTLLGAIRHKGFIPWDDDIDVMMPRDDYEKLMNIYSSNYKNSKYSIINHHNNNSYFYPIAKMYNNETIIYENSQKSSGHFGVYIDIFPMDYYIEDNQFNINLVKKIENNTNRLLYSQYKYSKSNTYLRSILKYVVLSSCSIVGGHYFLKKIDALVKKIEQGNKQTLRNLSLAEHVQPIIDIDSFNFYEEVIFEDTKFRIIKNADKYLRILYGDYMQLPPESKRVSNHSYNAYYL